jgi:lipopolysaccharide transport system ATP-binding protein
MADDIVIRAEGLGKKYVIGHEAQRERYVALRDVIARGARSALRKAADMAKGRMVVPGDTVEEFWALKDVSFEVKRGEVLGIIGRNGAGKSTLLKILSRITEPTEGRVTIKGRVASLLEVGTGFHPELTGRENIFLNGAVLGMTRAEIKRKFDEIVAFAEVEKFLDTPVKRYSSGMYVRLAFAVAAHLEPEILVVDEVLAVGDAEFQKKCLGKMQDVSQGGRTVMFVSHNIQAIRQLCQRVLVLQQGHLIFSGEVSGGINRYSGVGGELSAGSHDLKDYPRPFRSNGVRLLHVDFLDQNGASASQVTQSSDLTVVVRFVVEREMDGLDLAMAAIHVEGQRVFSELYSDQLGTMNLSSGEYTIQFSIPLRFFRLDSYFLTLAILEQSRTNDLIEGIPLPEIVDPDADPHTESHRWGIVRVPVSWTKVMNSRGDQQTDASSVLRLG